MRLFWITVADGVKDGLVLKQSSRLNPRGTFPAVFEHGLQRRMDQHPSATLRYLLPYSPDINPIEPFFAKLKALRRKAAARTLETLVAAIAAALSQFTPNECANFLADSGYRN